MFLSSYENLRLKLLDHETFTSMAHLGARGFDSIGGEVVSTTAFVIKNAHMSDFKGGYLRLIEGNSEAAKQSDFKQAIADPDCGWFFRAAASDFEKIPGSPIAYWVGDEILNAFVNGEPFESVAPTRKGMVTAGNHLYVRDWFEVSIEKSGLDRCISRTDAKNSGKKWFSYLKGGGFRKWYGNKFDLVNWENDGWLLQNTRHPTEDRVWATNFNLDYIFEPNVNWGAVTSSAFSARFSDGGELFDAGGSGCFPSSISPKLIIAFLNSKVAGIFLRILNPTLNFQAGNIGNLPITKGVEKYIDLDSIESMINCSKRDWNSAETSWDFSVFELIDGHNKKTLSDSYLSLSAYWQGQTGEMQRLEVENNRLFIEAYSLQDEVTPEVPLSEITLTCNPHYRYPSESSDEKREERLKSDTMRELVSYAVGCMMGRYSLAEPGLIYAHSGGDGFDPSRYGAFPADDDGIIPLTEEQWFADDAAARIEEFLGIAWPDAPVMETMTTLIDGLSMDKAGEPRAALRYYLSKQFYKDHLQTYKNRPIYWLFSSGKHKAFEALVYLHRYNEGTLARMRTNHVTPLMGKLQQRISDLDAEIATSSSSAEKTRKSRDKDKIAKQLIELRAFDEELRHLADQRIALDLDDGVKVNYAKFGNLLAFKDKVCPKKMGEDE